MAIYKSDIVDINLETCNIHRAFLNRTIGSGDSGADHFGIRVFRDGEPVDLTGVSVQGIFLPPQGSPIAITDGNSVSGNEAYVVLPQACYNYDGQFCLSIKLVGGGVTGTMRIVDGMVDNTHSTGTVAPTETVPTYQEILSTYDDMVAATAAANGAIAKPYAQLTFPVKKGDYTIVDGALKRALVDIATSETYTAAHWTDAKLGPDLSQLKSAIQNELLDGNCLDVLKFLNSKTGTHRDVVYTWNEDKSACTVSGKATGGNSVNNMFLRSYGSFPFGIVPGGTYRISYSATNVIFQVLIYKNNSLDTVIGATASREITIPADASGIDIRLFVESGVTASETVYPKLFTCKTNAEIVSEMKKVLENVVVSSADAASIYNKDASTLPLNSFIWIGMSSYDDMPSDVSSSEYGWIFTFSTSARGETATVKTQILIIPNPASSVFDMYYRRVQRGTMSAWVKNDCVKFSDSPVVQGGVLPTGTDIDDLKTAGVYVLNSANTYYHSPFPAGACGTITVLPGSANTISQIAMRNSSSPRYRNSSLGTFGDWIDIQNVNNFETTVNENSYTINCSPEITTDTNNFLASTGDNTDRTADIQAMLNTTGVCRLGPGKFMVSGVDVPQNGYLCGSGNSTIVQLFDQTSEGAEQDAYAIKLESYGAVENLRIFGASSAVSLLDTVDANKKPIGKRHGIVFAGTKTDSTTPGQITYYRSRISGVTITRCSGGGITCTGTGVEVQAHLLISDCEVYGCGIGLNIPFYSEFHRISNCAFQFNYFGTVDNGGNNNFSCCDFSKNHVGIFIDNSNDQSRNNTHGTFSACTVHHSVDDNDVTNKGIALKILGASNCETFTGLQLSNGAIIIDDSIGIRFVGARFGSNTPITITDSTVTTFSDTTFRQAPDHADSTFTQSNNTVLKFTDCYLTDGTVYDPMTS